MPSLSKGDTRESLPNDINDNDKINYPTKLKNIANIDIARDNFRFIVSPERERGKNAIFLLSSFYMFYQKNMKKFSPLFMYLISI